MPGKTVPGTPAWLRSRNDRVALQLLLEQGPLTRNRIGELTGLSKPTASQIVQRLEAAEVITGAGVVSASRGPGAAAYAVRTDQARGVAIDIDARAIRSSVVDVTGDPHPTARRPLPDGARSPIDDVRAGITQACQVAGIAESDIDAVCIGVQGSVDPRTDELRFADTLGTWPRTAVRARLEDELGLAVTIENDVNLAAVAERHDGAGAGLGGFALLWLGEGLGLATDLGGTLQRGTSGGAGEIGYLPAPRAAAAFDPDAAELQDLIGGIPVAALTRAAGGDGADYEQAIATLTADPRVRAEVIAALAPRVALGVVPVLALLDPERIVLGGATAIACGAALAEAVAQAVRRTTQWTPDVVTTRVIADPVLAGARDMLRHHLRATLFDRLDRLAH